MSGLLIMAWPSASEKRESRSSWQRILSHKENRAATFLCLFFYTYRCILWPGCLILFQESAWNGRECLPENREISCRLTIFGLQSGSFPHSFCLSLTWEGVWILIIAFIICYGKVPSVFEWHESHKPVFLSAVLPWVGNISHRKRVGELFEHEKATVWKENRATPANDLSF